MQPPPPPPAEHSPLQRAAALLKTGQRAEALAVLKAYVLENRTSEEAWYLLSFAFEDQERQIRAIEQLLVINPANSHAQARLEKLTAVDKEQTPSGRQPPSRKTLIWAASGILLIFLAFILFRPRPAAPPPDGDPATIATSETATPSLTPYTFPSATPATQAAATTPTLSPAPPPAAPTEPPLNAAISAQMDEIQDQVAALRRLEILSPVPRFVIQQNQVHPILEAAYLARNTRDNVADQALVLTALGLIEPNYDLYNKIINQLGEGIGGFYIPWTDELYVIGEQFSGVERFVFAHEFTHALADQHFSLDSLGVYPECLSETDHCLAIAALVEGDATYLMNRWLETYGSEDDLNDILAAQYAPLEHSISSSDLPPPYVVRELNFRYRDGYNFIEHLYQVGRWKMVDLAYGRLPQTSEQILHPDKYQAGEDAIPVAVPSLGEILGESWRFLGSDTLGELGTEMILGYSAHRLAQIDPETATRAATGWGGDSYQVYYKGTTNRSILAVHWVWDSRWEEDHFWEAMQQHLNLRYRGDSVNHKTGLCWQLLNDHVSCIFHTDTETLWLLAPDVAMIDLVRGQYPAFP